MPYAILFGVEIQSSQTDKHNPGRHLNSAAILIAGILVAGAILYTGRKNELPEPRAQLPQEEHAVKIRRLGQDDHFRGDENAKLIIVEYSDMDCPFCRMFHGTMKQIIAEYGGDGRVAWVYRHFPLDQLHQNARKKAEATECAAALGGNDAFWNYTDRFFETAPQDSRLDLELLAQIAADIGLKREEFESCLNSGVQSPRVSRDYEDAVNAGVQGTPNSFVIDRDGKIIANIPGALPIDEVRELIENALIKN